MFRKRLIMAALALAGSACAAGVLARANIDQYAGG